MLYKTHNSFKKHEKKLPYAQTTYKQHKTLHTTGLSCMWCMLFCAKQQQQKKKNLWTIIMLGIQIMKTATSVLKNYFRIFYGWNYT